MMNLKKYVEKRGKTSIFIFVLTDLEREIKEYIVFVMKAKTHLQVVFQKRNLFD